MDDYTLDFHLQESRPRQQAVPNYDHSLDKRDRGYGLHLSRSCPVPAVPVSDFVYDQLMNYC